MKSTMTVRALVAGAAFAFAASASALDNIKFMVGANPGGGYDQTARQLGDAMKAAGTIKNYTVDNRGGAGGTIGLAQFVNTSKGDGNAMIVTGLIMVGAIELNKPPVTLKNVTPLARLTSEYEVLVVPANSPIKTLDDVIKQLKANPGSVSWAGGSKGGVDHILVAQIAKAVGVDPAKINYIPFQGGGEATAAILGGQVTVGVSGLGEFVQQINAGRMRGIAVSSGKRIEGINIPTLIEQKVNVELFNWRGVMGAPGISQAERDELIKAITAAVNSPAWKETLKKLDWSPSFETGDAFGKFLDQEQARVATVLKDAGLTK